MSGVTPLARDPRGRVRTRAAVAPPAPDGHQPEARPTEPAEPPGDSFVAPGVDRRELRRLRRGTYPAAQVLDLHGQTVAAAAASVERFIAAARSRHRCVAIVHGRGLHSGERGAVLKSQVRARLRTHPAVLAFADAPVHAGGDGAVYVLLRG